MSHIKTLCLQGIPMQDSLKILESVNNFYSQSFSQLMSITVAVLAFAGIILPILVTIYQKRLFKLEHEAIENSLTKKMSEELENAVKEIRAEYEEKEKHFVSEISKMKQELNSEVDKAKGGISHVAGCTELERKYFFNAFDCFIQACISYIKGRDNLNLRRVVYMVSDNCLPNLSSSDIENNGDTFKRLEEVIEQLTEYDTNGIFTDQLRGLKYQLSQCQKRKVTDKSVA